MDRRKALKDEYKQRQTVGGVFKVTNTRNGRYLLDYSTDIEARKNAFQFTASSGSCFDYRLRQDWDALGGKVFAFETLETIEKKQTQTQDQFIEDLKALAQLWSERLDRTARY